MGRNTKIVGGILLVAIVLVAVGYAAITKVGLKIDGTAKSEANKDNFKVELVGEPQTSGDGNIRHKTIKYTKSIDKKCAK